jgi:hypothetical protein
MIKGGCAAVGIGEVDEDEVSEARVKMDQVNEVVYAAAKSAGFEFVDLRKTFEGRSCGSPDPWINCVVMTSVNGTDVRQSFHPTSDGDSAIANALLAHPSMKAFVGGKDVLPPASVKPGSSGCPGDGRTGLLLQAWMFAVVGLAFCILL